MWTYIYYQNFKDSRLLLLVKELKDYYPILVNKMTIDNKIYNIDEVWSDESKELVEVKLSIAPDKIVEDVISQYRERSKLGIEKYGTSLENSKEDILAFLNHAQQEAMDLTLYIEKIKQMFYEQK